MTISRFGKLPTKISDEAIGLKIEFELGRKHSRLYSIRLILSCFQTQLHIDIDITKVYTGQYFT